VPQAREDGVETCLAQLRRAQVEVLHGTPSRRRRR
jgi:hypothetical protein